MLRTIGSPRKKPSKPLLLDSRLKISCTFTHLWFLPTANRCFFSSDFDDTPAVEGRPSGLAATEVLSHTPAAANLLAGTSSNPLDDLVSIFGAPTAAPPSASPHDIFNGLAMNNEFSSGAAGSLGSPATQSPLVANIANVSPQSNQPQPQEDLLGLF